MKKQVNMNIPVGNRTQIFSKLYYGVLSKSLETLDIERYFSILYFLNENNGCSQQCVCDNLVIDKTAMVSIINYLMKMDYIKRRVNPGDRRGYFIVLTKKGKKHTEEIVRSFNTIDKKIFSTISKGDQTTFIRVLNILSDNLKELPGSDMTFQYKKKKDRENPGLETKKAIPLNKKGKSKITHIT